MELGTINESDLCHEVWIGNKDGMSNPIKSIWPLNMDSKGSDILFESEEIK